MLPTKKSLKPIPCILSQTNTVSSHTISNLYYLKSILSQTHTILSQIYTVSNPYHTISNLYYLKSILSQTHTILSQIYTVLNTYSLQTYTELSYSQTYTVSYTFSNSITITTNLSNVQMAKPSYLFGLIHLLCFIFHYSNDQHVSINFQHFISTNGKRC